MASFDFLTYHGVLKWKSISYLWLKLFNWPMIERLDRFRNRDREEIMSFPSSCKYPFQKPNTGQNALSVIDHTIWNQNILSNTTQIRLIHLWRPLNATNFVISHPTIISHLLNRTIHLFFKTIQSTNRRQI